MVPYHPVTPILRVHSKTSYGVVTLLITPEPRLCDREIAVQKLIKMCTYVLLILV